MRFTALHDCSFPAAACRSLEEGLPVSLGSAKTPNRVDIPEPISMPARVGLGLATPRFGVARRAQACGEIPRLSWGKTTDAVRETLEQRPPLEGQALVLSLRELAIKFVSFRGLLQMAAFSSPRPWTHFPQTPRAPGKSVNPKATQGLPTPQCRPAFREQPSPGPPYDPLKWEPRPCPARAQLRACPSLPARAFSKLTSPRHFKSKNNDVLKTRLKAVLFHKSLCVTSPPLAYSKGPLEALFLSGFLKII